ncbi:hypothetical protein [Streptomyces acidiscabies]|uniref:Uncharacterized protein n=1 Tax=Streptomyces acidiscabies TaxID=42234 RepID=A0AAP6ELS8_9ACTN|nr:hypothetical protein [Streptomyces acidiscabies]MDX2967384.1 hypothetical protein [Streptomyces acidiscabies]MDX3019633.1 hypothetical protein [Streptomyces acidiscabies]MDX3792201.1 hypothetical protein [Streptomyces acidiscabies]
MPYVEQILDQVLTCCSVNLTEVQLHVFGSAIKPDNRQPKDVDILLVYREGNLSLAHDICDRIRSLVTYPPIDILALSLEEERETNFIEGVNAKRFWPSEDAAN